jgi:hypothetical protein
MINSFQSWKTERFQDAAGGLRLTPYSPQKKTQLVFTPLAWYEPDPTRDGFAKDFLQLKHIVPIPSKRMYELWSTCAATGADMQDPSYLRYWLTVHPSGSGTCTCPDWINRGGACKHLRAFRIVIEEWSAAGKLQYRYHFPTTQEDALHIREQNLLWYGINYEDAVTLPAVNAIAVPRPTTLETLCANSSHIPLQPINAPLPSVEQQAELQMDMEALSNLPPDIMPLDSTNLLVNQRAIKTQIQQRYQHYIAQTLPILHGMNTLLNDSFPCSTTENLDDFIATLTRLSDRLT